MQTEFYRNLYVSECWREKKEKIKKRLRQNRLQPWVYVIALAQGQQNQLEFFSSLLLKQKILREGRLFVVGLADGYDGALCLVEQITEQVYRETGGAEIRRYILERQEESEEPAKREER